MSTDQYNLNLTSGMDVKGSDGEKVGTVQDVQGNYVIVSKGFFFPTDYYIPFSAISTADEDNVYLNVTKDGALNQGWDQVPDTTSTTTTSSAVYDEPVVEADRTVDRTIEDSDRIDLTLSEEELTAQKRAVERGEVRIDKTIVSEEQSIDVPVTEERVHVSRTVVDRDARPGDNSFEEGTIEVPVYGEEVELGKRTRVREELEITKDQVQDTERVSGTVRHEEARVTDESGSVVGEGQTKSKKKSNR